MTLDTNSVLTREGKIILRFSISFYPENSWVYLILQEEQMRYTIVKTERDDVREKEEEIKLRLNRIGRMVDN